MTDKTEPKPAPAKAAEPKPAPAKAAEYVVAKGKAVTTRKGIKSDGASIDAGMLAGGADALATLVKCGAVVKS